MPCKSTEGKAKEDAEKMATSLAAVKAAEAALMAVGI
jgi:hypothetical protein